MGMNSVMSAKQTKNGNGLREKALMKMYKDDRNFRADKLIESWSRIPEVK